MNPKLQLLQSSMAKADSAPFTKSLVDLLDFLSKAATKRHYQGVNPAIAKVYGPLRISILFMLAITLLTVVFGMVAPIDSAAIAKGNVAVMTKRKTVQHLEGGIIKSILVKEGDVVVQGQPLIEISDVAPKANRSIVEVDLWTERAAEARLLSLRQRKETLEFPQDIQAAAQSHADVAKTLQAQTELFTTQRDTQTGRLNTLEQRIAEAQAEITGLKAQVRSADAQLIYLKDETESVARLYEKGLSTKPRLLGLQRQSEELKGTRGQNMAQIAKVEQGITETKMQIINQENEFATQIAEELKEVQSKISDHKEKLNAASDVMARTIVVAPSEGIVTGLKFHTIGGVINPGAAILDIVPQNEQLVLEVKIQPTDIDVVKPGLESRVIFPAYKARRMPLFHGKVIQVSADAFTEQEGAHAVSYYTAKVEVDGKQITSLDTPINLYPGMPADVYINTGSRSFLSYLFAPVTDSMRKAFKEE